MEIVHIYNFVLSFCFSNTVLILVEIDQQNVLNGHIYNFSFNKFIEHRYFILRFFDSNNNTTVRYIMGE